MTASALRWGFDKLEELVEAWQKDRDEHAYREVVKGYMADLNNVQRQMLKACLELARGKAGLVFGWMDKDDTDPVLTALGLFLDEEAIRPLKYSPSTSNQYRFAPWFFDFLEENPHLLDEQID